MVYMVDFLTGLKIFCHIGLTQYVSVGGESSEELAVMSGVSQGSVLGPTLSIYFIDDMPEIVNCFNKIFADDTKMYTTVQSEEHCRLMQNNIDQLVQWTKDWQLKFNNDKCKISQVGKNNPEFRYFKDDRELQCTEGEKDLGVFVDKDLKFEQYINETVKKAYKIAGMITHYIQHKEIMVPLFKLLVRPTLEYGNVVWAPCLIKNITCIENVQMYYWHEQPGA